MFEGTVRLVGDPAPLQAVLLVADNRLKVSSREFEIGDWDLADISASLLPDGCHVAVEGEELIISVPEPMRFAEAIGPHLTNPGDGSLRNLGKRRRPDEGTGGIRQRAVRPAAPLALRTRVLAATGVGAIALAVWAPVILMTTILLAALAALLIGAFALMDPFTAVRLPDPATPTLLIRMGIAGVTVAIALTLIL